MLGTVVITGASAGIGEACARSFAKLGARLVLGARRTDKLAAVAEACRALGAPEVLALPLDTRSLESITSFAAAAEALVPEIVINNAGLARGRDPVAHLHDEDVTAMIDTNVTGFVRVARAFTP